MAKLKPYLFLPFVLFAFTCKGQVYFNKTYSSGLPDSAQRGEGIYKFISINDSEYVFNMFSNNDVNGELNNYFIKTDLLGNIKKSTVLGYPNHYFWLRGLIKTSNGNYLMSGSDYDYSTGHSNAMLLMFNANLDTLWNKFYKVGDWLNYGAVDVIETFDNGFISIGNSSNAIDTMDIWILRTDSMGNQLWDTTLTQPYWQNGYSIAATDDSCFILGCMAQNAPGGPPPLIWLAKIDDNKKIAWSKYVYGIGATAIQNLMKTKDGKFLSIGVNNKSWGQGTNENYGLIVKFDFSGNILKYKVHGSPLQRSEYWNAIEEADGGFIIGGNIFDTVPGNYEADGYIVKLDSALDTLWTQTIKIDSLGYIDYFFNIARTHDGGFACTGMRIGTIPYNTDGWVIKFDSLGCQSANCWLGINETTLHKTDLPFVFPNPTNDFCIVRFTHQGPVQVEVFDDIGRQIKNVRALPFGDTDIHIDLRQAPNGMLFIRLKNGSNILSTKIIKK